MNSKPGRRKFIVPIAIIAVPLAYFFTVSAQFSVSGKPSLDMLLVWAALNLVIYLWLRLRSGWKFQTQIYTIVTGIVLQSLFVATVQVEGILGNGRPVFAWRWSPLPADEFKSTSLGISTGTIELSAEAIWPQFRGKNRDGVTSEQIASWKQHPPELMWKQPIGAGWASFAVVGEHCFTLEQRGDEECLVCYRVKDGKQVWINARAERFREISGGEGPRATPTYSDGLLYSLGATGVLQCVDARTGGTVWETDVLQFNDGTNCLFGMCGSPLVTDGKVIVAPGGSGCSLVAFDKQSGHLVWKNGDADASYSSPVQMRLCGVDQVLNFNGDGLFAHDLSTGTVLWNIEWISNEDEKNNVCQPIQLDEDEVFISSAYGMGCAKLRIEKNGDQWNVSTVWENQNLKSKFSSAIFNGSHIFGLDLGVLVCLDPTSGNRVWKNGRYAHGQFIKVGDYLVVQSEKGFVAQVVASAHEFSEMGRIKALRYRTWTHPVVADGVLLVRNDREMAAYRLTSTIDGAER